ncbi:MAG: chemotaxis protein CheR [Rickettsiales bacterium]|jgi:chemotaxis protein methyltransferase CheR|nr:chemotaxis protein CheR [Rickettsiales bacterium]
MMTPQDFTYVITLVKDRSGIALTEGKEYLVESRLLPLARKHGMTTITELVAYVKTAKDEALTHALVEAMTTNESSFFRDTKPFDHLRNLVLPHLMDTCKKKGKIRIWSAACSTGQEAYSIAMTLLELPSCKDIPIEIIGTDINTQVVEKAEKGIYSQFEVQRGLPITMLVKYFTQERETWQVKDNLRALVKFKQQNLLGDLRNLGRFDIIFCRNVLIYFDAATKTQVLQGLKNCMEPHALLYLGSTESIMGLAEDCLTQFDANGIYKLK